MARQAKSKIVKAIREHKPLPKATGLGSTRFQNGNQLWKCRTKIGRGKLFTDPDVLWEACVEYFLWAEEHPLTVERVFSYQGTIVKGTENKKRVLTITGLCLFLGIPLQTWIDYRNNNIVFSEVIAKAEQHIYQDKFEGATSDLYNANIISRDLGLIDKRDVTVSDVTEQMLEEGRKRASTTD